MSAHTVHHSAPTQVYVMRVDRDEVFVEMTRFLNTNGIRLAPNNRFVAELGQRNRAVGRSLRYWRFSNTDAGPIHQQQRSCELGRRRLRATGLDANGAKLANVTGARCRPGRAGLRAAGS